MEKLALLGGKRIREKTFETTAIIGEEERRRVGEVLDSGMLSGFIATDGEAFFGGRQVREFEALIQEYFDARYAITMNSATSGLHAALAACGIAPGDEVIVTPYTMSATATAIVMLSAIPVFADIEEHSFCIDPESIKEKITTKTKAIVVVHLFGRPADMDGIMCIAKEHNLYVIEDCAQAPGAIHNREPVGKIGDIGVFSLNQHKTITSGEGGFAITDSEKLALRMQLIRNHGESVVEKMGIDKIDNIVGYNYRMTELEAAVAIGQFRRLDELNEHRIKLAEYLTERLSGLEGLILPGKPQDDKHVYFVYPIRFDEGVMGVSRDIFVKALSAEGIPFAAGYVRAIYLAPMYQQKTAHGGDGRPFSLTRGVDYSKGICPVCERMHEKELMLTSVCRYPYGREDIDDVIKAFGKIYDNIDSLKAV